MIGGFVLKFGRLGEGFKIYYDLTVRFKDASGLLKGLGCGAEWREDWTSFGGTETVERRRGGGRSAADLRIR